MVVVIAVLAVFKNFFYRIPVAVFQQQFVMIKSLLKYLDNGDTPMLLQYVKSVQGVISGPYFPVFELNTALFLVRIFLHLIRIQVNTVLFLVRIFLYSVRMQENTDQK